MKKAIETEIGEGKIVLIEVAESPDIVNREPPGGAGAGLTSPQKLLASLDQVSDTISTICNTMFEKMSAGFRAGRPNEITIEFGVTLGGEAGVPLVTKGKAEATFKVAAKWQLDQQKGA